MAKLGCKTVADLQKVDARKLIDASTEFALNTFPERDGNILPADPQQAYANGAVKDITFLQGCNKDEMNFFVSDVMGAEGFPTWAADADAAPHKRQWMRASSAVRFWLQEGWYLA